MASFRSVLLFTKHHSFHEAMKKGALGALFLGLFVRVCAMRAHDEQRHVLRIR